MGSRPPYVVERPVDAESGPARMNVRDPEAIYIMKPQRESSSAPGLAEPKVSLQPLVSWTQVLACLVAVLREAPMKKISVYLGIARWGAFSENLKIFQNSKNFPKI